MSQSMIIFDVWGGEYSQDHVARYIVSVDEALSLARHELQQGYLVNLRAELAWGPYQPFDHRVEDGSAEKGAATWPDKL